MIKKYLILISLFIGSIFNAYCISNVLYNKNTNKYSCVHKSYLRQFMLFLPDGFEKLTVQEKMDVPLIIMLHGAGSDSEGFKNMTGFETLACKNNYAVVYVDGTVTQGKPGSLTGWHYFNDKKSKRDVDFIISLSEYLRKEYKLNEKCFIAGYSNGGFMVNKLACQYSRNFTAAVSVAGMMPEPVWKDKKNAVDIGFLQINGTKDDLVPMKINGTDKYNPNPDMESVIQYFAEANCLSNENLNIYNSKKYLIQNYDDKVCWILLNEGHHTWPEKEISSLDCNKIILEFFDSFKTKNKKSILFENLMFPDEPELLDIFRKSYPDITFDSKYSEEYEDWLITVNTGAKKYDLYWNNGSMLPEDEMKNRTEYWTLLYNYDYKKPLQDPSDFSDEQIAAMKKFGSDENRKSSAGTPMFFFDAIYDGNSRAALEKHIISVKFLGFNVNVHERLREPLKIVEKRIYEASEKDTEIINFLKMLGSNGGYYWRIIANTNRKSFHSLGIALDLQPKSYGWKEVYWSWAKDKNPDGWMLTPLKDRWMPPQKVIDIFEEEGFIWGGKWGIWDNMHFEYHPELINMAKRKG